MNNYGKNDPRELEGHKLSTPDLRMFSIDNDSRHIGVQIEDLKACPRYSAITLSGITVADSPEWLKNRLLAIGLRPINNIVDITNFVLMEYGQPLHAFDADKITGNKVVVRKFPEGTGFVTLDGVERKLSQHDLMICNETEPMCIAGVFGGLHSGVTADTKNIFLESACFDPVHVRKTSRLHGLQTDASFRFERGSDIDVTIDTLKRATMLIKEIAGGVISSEIVDVYPEPVPEKTVLLDFNYVDRLIGKSLNHAVICNILTDLGITISDPASRIPHPASHITLRIPNFKVDVTRDADVIEDILRVYGYNNIFISEEIKASLSYTKKPDPEVAQNIVSDFLVSNGFYEMMNNSLTKSVYYSDSTSFPADRSVRILNPISRDLDVMRQTLLFGALESLAWNINRKTADLKLFEFGRVYAKSDKPDEPLKGYHEETHLAMVVTGRNHTENWNTGNNPSDFFELKGILSALFSRLNLAPGLWNTDSYQSEIYNEGLCYTVKGEWLVKLGPVSPAILKIFDVRQPVYCIELNWDRLFSLVSGQNIRFRGLPRFPEVRRDLALLVDKNVNFGELEKVAFQTEKKLLKQVGLFDVYEGEKLAPGKKSYAISFVLQDDEKTLTDKEIDKTMERLTRVFSEKFSAQLR